MYNGIQIIAEVKTKSPFGYTSDKTWDELFAVVNMVGDIISIHTDPRWGGSFELITYAKARTQKPILAKGIHATDEDVIEAIKRGADYVLVVGRMPNVHLEKCIIEPLSLAELQTIPETIKVVWNSRDLSNGGMKQETFRQARELFTGWLCQASNIKTVKDIEAGANAVLVGTNFVEFANSLNAS